MTTVNVDGRDYSAVEGQTARFDAMKKTELVKMIATEGPTEQGVAFWRVLPKETLVIVAADMFSKAIEKAGQAAADAEPGLPVDSFSEGTLNFNRVDGGWSCTNAGGVTATGATPDEARLACLKAVMNADVAEPEQASKMTPTEQAVNTQATSGPSDDKGPYVLRCTVLEGWLRRDQPRKPGDKATYKRVEDKSKASIYKTLRQAEVKLQEVASLYDDRDHQAEVVKA